MTDIRLLLLIALLLPALWGCEESEYTGNPNDGDDEVAQPAPGPDTDITDVQLTPAQKALLSDIESDIADHNYSQASTDVAALLQAHPDSEQIKRLYSDVLALQAGISPRDFAIKMGTLPVKVRDENGNRVEKVSTVSVFRGLMDLAAVSDDEDYQVRFMNGRHALALRLQGKNLQELPVAEQADIGAMAAVNATRLAYAAVGGKQSAESLSSRAEVENAVARNLPAVSEELTDTLNVLIETVDAVDQQYPIRELRENPMGASAVKNAFASTMLDDGELSTDEAVNFVYFVTGP